MIKQIAALLGFIALAFTAPAVSAVLFVSRPDDWYYALNKPWFNPPNWIFGPVWSFLYCTMGIAAWLVWRKGEAQALWLPMGLFGLQLLLNTLWTPLFFGMHRPGLALMDIGALWIAIAATTLSFYPISRMAACLFVPYWLWVSFAALLNAAIWWLNRN
ncbi:MAG TPA: tryptophan-rich sensory protein [Candidatus Hydrogenedentes bacterium]|nr:tryptophan-rich sensory protein [Candidatus Hydrogenedentota bacterium]HOS03220.1 tryptophan-rich sensory protein [Candidatus Hydrogenedentota bacterium]